MVAAISACATARAERPSCTDEEHNAWTSQCALATHEVRLAELLPNSENPWALLASAFEAPSDLAGSFVAECYDLLDHPSRMPSRLRVPLKRAHLAASSAGCTRESHVTWLRTCETDALRLPGTTREDLLRVFREEGGISTRTQRTYFHPRCQNLKVTVTFDEVGPADPWGESAQDVVLTAVPFIGFFIAD
jgi:hypothetical protein